MVTLKVSPGSTVAEPETTGAGLLVVWAVTVGIAGAVVSTTNSLVVTSADILPAESVTMAVTS